MNAETANAIGIQIIDAIDSGRSLFGKSLKSIASAFEAVDTDGSKELSHDELSAALLRLGCNTSDDQVKSLFKRVDSDNTGKINYREFESFLIASLAAVPVIKKRLSKARKSLSGDLDASGKKPSSMVSAKFEARASMSTANTEQAIANTLVQATLSNRSLFGQVLSSVEDAFDAMDKDANHSLSQQEFFDGMKRLGLCVPKIQEAPLFAVLAGADGVVTIDEFCNLLAKSKVKARGTAVPKGFDEGGMQNGKRLKRGSIGVMTAEKQRRLSHLQFATFPMKSVAALLKHNESNSTHSATALPVMKKNEFAEIPADVTELTFQVIRPKDSIECDLGVGLYSSSAGALGLYVLSCLVVLLPPPPPPPLPPLLSSTTIMSSVPDNILSARNTIKHRHEH